MCLDTKDINTQAEAFLGQTIGVGHEDKEKGWLVTPDRCTRVNMALDYIKLRHEELGGPRIDAECQSNPGSYFGRDDWYGTCDVTLTAFDNPPGVLEVIDYKDGQTYVDVKKNSQLIGYAGGKLSSYLRHENGVVIDPGHCGIKTVRMTIVQPKISKNPIRFVDIPVVKFWGMVVELNGAAKKTDDPDAPLIAGDWCGWCPHKPNCPEHTAQGTNALVITLQSAAVAVQDMSGDQLADIMGVKADVDTLFTKVQKEIETRVNAGVYVPCYGKGKGNKSKAWIEDAEKKLIGMGFKKADLWPASFITPAKALEKADLTDRQRKKIEDELIVVKPGKDKVVRTNIKVMSIDEMFADVPKKEDFSTLSFN
jgi:hypothetical protein